MNEGGRKRVRDQVNGMTYHDIAAPAGEEGRVEEERKTGKEEESAKLGNDMA